jgi:hypothetical protein
MKRVAITDHSQATLEAGTRNYRVNLKRWKNMHNDLDIIFGVE